MRKTDLGKRGEVWAEGCGSKLGEGGGGGRGGGVVGWYQDGEIRKE